MNFVRITASQAAVQHFLIILQFHALYISLCKISFIALT